MLEIYERDQVVWTDIFAVLTDYVAKEGTIRVEDVLLYWYDIRM